MQNKIVLVVSPKGSGKTYQVAKSIEKMDRVAIFDVVHEQAYAIHTVIEGRPAELAREMARDKTAFKIAYRPICIAVQPNGLIDSAEFEPFVKLCFLRGDCYMVIDEAHLLCNARNCPPSLMIANLVGRHRKLSMVLVAQSFSGIHPAIRKNADELIFWKIIEPSDLEGIRDRCGKDVEEQVRQLRGVERDDNDDFKAPGQMLRWDKTRGVIEVTE